MPKVRKAGCAAGSGKAAKKRKAIVVTTKKKLQQHQQAQSSNSSSSLRCWLAGRRRRVHAVPSKMDGDEVDMDEVVPSGNAALDDGHQHGPSSSTPFGFRRFFASLKPTQFSVSKLCSPSSSSAEVGSSPSVIDDNFRLKPPDAAEDYQFRSADPPMPPLNFAEPKRFFNLMCWKETVYRIDSQLFQRHADLEPRFRAVLVDWISEVCDVHNLHRETFYLAVDFIDRYLSKEKAVPKTRLQLVGVTCLFIAAKAEEIYPPKLADFAYVTDGACNEAEILGMELVILQALNWALSPVSVVQWLGIYLQLIDSLAACGEAADSPLKSPLKDGCCHPDYEAELTSRFIVVQFQRAHFVQLCRLLDLCCLDVGWLCYRYGLLAAAAIHSLFSPAAAVFAVTGFTEADLADCLQWMAPSVQVICELEDEPTSGWRDVAADDQHNIQCHSVDLSTLNRVAQYKYAQLRATDSTPKTAASADVDSLLPTPPDSNERLAAGSTPTAADASPPASSRTPGVQWRRSCNVVEAMDQSVVSGGQAES